MTPMAHLKYVPVETVELGRVPEELLPTWQRLYAVYKQVRELEKETTKEISAFFQKLVGSMPLNPEHLADSTDLSIDEDGVVSQQVCECPLCQSKFQSVPLGPILQALAAEGMDPEDLAAIREDAADERTEEEAERLLARLMN